MNEYLKLSLTALATGVIGSGTTLAIVELWMKSKSENRDRTEVVTHLALRLAFLFEGYALDCADKVVDSGNARSTQEAVGHFMSEVPQLSALPSDNAYRFIQPEILNRIFGLPQRAHMAQRSVGFVLEIGGQDDYLRAIEDTTVRLGAEAAELAKDIRDKYRLGKRPLRFEDWNIDEYFKKAVAAIEERAAELEKEHRERK